MLLYLEFGVSKYEVAALRWLKVCWRIRIMGCNAMKWKTWNKSRRRRRRLEVQCKTQNRTLGGNLYSENSLSQTERITINYPVSLQLDMLIIQSTSSTKFVCFRIYNISFRIHKLSSYLCLWFLFWWLRTPAYFAVHHCKRIWVVPNWISLSIPQMQSHSRFLYSN